MNTLAVYNEARLGSKRKFELYPEKIVVTISGLGGTSAEISYPLNALQAEHGKIWAKDQRLLIVFGIFIITCFIATMGYMGTYWMDRSLVFFLVPIGVTVTALILLNLYVRRIEYSAYCSKAGVLVLYIGKIGGQREHYEEFIALLENQIRTVSKE